MKNSVASVNDFLLGQGVSFALKTLSDSARTAPQAAAALGCEVGQIAKSLVFEKPNGEVILVVAAGDNRVDVKKVESAANTQLIMCPANRVKAKAGFAIGGVAPVAHPRRLQTFLDPDLQRYPIIWAAAGTPHSVFSITPDDLGNVTGGQWLTVAEQ